MRCTILSLSVFFTALLYNSIIRASVFPVNKPLKTINERIVARHNATDRNNIHKTKDSEDIRKKQPPSAKNDENIPFRLPRFIQTQINEQAKKTEDELLVVQGNELKRDETTAKAKRKRKIASILRKAAEYAHNASAEGEKKNRRITSKGHPELTNEEFQEVANIRRAKVLEFEAGLLENKAKTYNKLANGAKLDLTGFPICTMLKIAPLEFVPTLDEVRDRIDHTVMGELNGNTLTIIQRKRPRLTYDVKRIQLPIFNVADTGFGFNYHGTDQLFCTVNEVSRNSWMDALSEAWFCHNEGLQGMLPSVEATEEAIRTKAKIEKPTPKPNLEKTTPPQPLVDINVGLNENGEPKLIINGQDVSKKATS